MTDCRVDMRIGRYKHGSISVEGVWLLPRPQRKSFGSVEPRNSYDDPDHSGYDIGPSGRFASDSREIVGGIGDDARLSTRLTKATGIPHGCAKVATKISVSELAH